MVPPLDKTIIGFGEGRIAKNTGVVDRINSVQVARNHTRLAAAVAIRPSRRRSGAENPQGGGGACKRDENLPSTHGGFLLLPEATRIESRADRPSGKGATAVPTAELAQLFFWVNFRFDAIDVAKFPLPRC
jgi:hypothetical protein